MQLGFHSHNSFQTVQACISGLPKTLLHPDQLGHSAYALCNGQVHTLQNCSCCQMKVHLSRPRDGHWMLLLLKPSFHPRFGTHSQHIPRLLQTSRTALRIVGSFSRTSEVQAADLQTSSTLGTSEVCPGLCDAVPQSAMAEVPALPGAHQEGGAAG